MVFIPQVIEPITNTSKTVKPSELVKDIPQEKVEQEQQEQKDEKVLATEALIQKLKNDNAQIRFQATLALSQEEKPENVDLLIELLTTSDPSIHPNLIWVLGRLQDSKAINPLIECTKNPNSNIRVYAACALQDFVFNGANNPLIEEAFVQLLNDTDVEVRHIAALTLGELGNKKVLQGLIECLSSEDSEDAYQALTLLSKIGNEDTASTLVNYVDSSKPLNLRYRGIRLLGNLAQRNITNPDSVDPLIKCLKDEDLSVQRLAAEALGKIKSKEAIEPLVNLLVNSAHGNIKPLNEINSLSDLVPRNKDYEVTWTAAMALSNTNIPEVIGPLYGCLGDDDPLVRFYALEALCKAWSNEPVIVPVLIDSLTTPDEELIMFARKAFHNVTQEILDYGTQKCLENSQPEARVRTILGLANSDDPRAVSHIVKFLNDDNESEDARNYARELLSQMRGETVMEGLKQCLDSKDIIVKLYAQIVLSKNQETQEFNSERYIKHLLSR